MVIKAMAALLVVGGDNSSVMAAAPEISTAGCGQKVEQFPKETVVILDSLYYRGMTGWGRSHTADIRLH